ncbi:MAG: fibronectin type III domain-containing protein [Pseudomonadota bacterium]
MAVIRNFLIGRAASGLTIPPGATFTALNLNVGTAADVPAGPLGTLLTVGAEGPVSVTHVSGQAGNVGQPVAGDQGGLFTIAADASFSFDPDGAFDALTPGQSAATQLSATLSDGANTDDAIVTVTVRASGQGQGQASAPAAITTLSAITTAGDLSLTWIQPADNGDAITDYILRQRAAGSSFWNVVPDEVSTATSAVISDLGAGDYEFSVLAVNGQGTGPISNIASATIAAQLPINQAAPVLAGAGTVGGDLTYTPGTWSDADSVVAELLRGGVPVAAYDGSPYTVQPTDDGFDFQIRETAINLDGSVEASSGVISVVAGFGPIPGVLNADNVVVLGASLMFRSFGDRAASASAYASAVGFTGTLQPRGVGGDVIDDTIAVYQTYESDFAGSLGSNALIIHTGGNNVSNSRPYPGGDTAISGDLDALITSAKANGDQVILMDLSKRLYSSAPTVVPGQADLNGSLPYNENIWRPLIESELPDWYDQGAPVVSFYDFVERYEDVLEPAGIHPDNHPGSDFYRAIYQFPLARIAARAKGLRNDSRMGRALVFDFGENSGNDDYLPAAVNRVPWLDSHPDPYKNVVVAAQATDGSIDHFIECAIEGFHSVNQGGNGAGAFPRLADTRLHDAEAMGDNLFVGTVGGNTVNSGTLTFRQLTPGDTLTVTVAASRSSTDTNRRGDVTVNGETLVLDASNTAVSNQITFTPFIVPATGEVQVRLDKRSDSSFGYISAVLLDFAEIADSAPLNVQAPSISGGSTLGSILTADDGAFSGSPSPTLSRQWSLDGVDLPGEVGQTYTADTAGEVRVAVTATNAVGSVTASSTVKTITAGGFDTLAAGLAPVWAFDGSDTTSITDDGGSPALVMAMSSQIGGVSLQQTSAGFRPRTGASTVNGLNVLDYASNDRLEFVGDPVAGVSGNLTLVAVVRFDETSQDYVFAASGSSGTILNLRYQNGQVRSTLGTGAGSATATVPFTPGAAMVVLLVSYDGATLTLEVDDLAPGTAAQTGVPDVSNAVGHLGATASGSNQLTGAIGEAILYATALTPADRSDLKAALTTKWVA